MASPPPSKPSVAVTGTGANRTYTDTRTGQTYKEPSYSAFSARGLTSSDPANVARNRAAAERYEAMGIGQGGGNGNSVPGGIASLTQKPAPEEKKPLTAADKRRLARLGAPTGKMGAIEVATPSYDLPRGMTPSVSYGMAFQGLQPAQYMPSYDLGSMDIFGAYPDFSTYMSPAANPYYGMYPGFGLSPMFGFMG